jgi:amino acid adenylation domain-containing protein
MSLDRAEGRSLRSEFLRTAAQFGERPALIVKGRTLTYREIDEAARRWAAVLLERRPGRPGRIGVFAYRSEVAYIGTLASLFSGAAFVPLNRTFPPQRTRTMVQRAALDALIVDRASAAQLATVLAGMEPPPLVLAPDADTDLTAVPPNLQCGAEVLATVEPLAQLPPVGAGDIAYLLFTSGTTGVPKGVAITHGNVTHFLDSVSPWLEYTADDRTSQMFDQTFDLSVFDLFATWRAGACLCVPQAADLIAPAVYANRQRLTTWFSVPSLVAHMRRGGQLKRGVLPHLRLSIFCGEALPRATVEVWKDAAPNSAVLNLYGPTELTIACSVYRWDDAFSPSECVVDVVPIGRPLPGLAALVVDDALKPVEYGEAGELCVCGPQTAPGYWCDAKRTAERFVPIEVGLSDTRIFYRTGDRVVRQPSGDYAYLGRVDHQIKVHGYRVELGEIEAAILQHPGVVAAAAIGWPLEDGSPEGIVAFAVGKDLEPEAVRGALRGKLPGYMLPARVLILDSLPLNVNGKTDRAALQSILDVRTADTDHP